MHSVGERGTPLKGVYPISPDEDEMAPIFVKGFLKTSL